MTYKLRTLKKWISDNAVPSDERKAFFINLYNCLMIDALVECSIQKSDKDGQERTLPVSPLKVNTVKRIFLQFQSFFIFFWLPIHRIFISKWFFVFKGYARRRWKYLESKCLQCRRLCPHFGWYRTRNFTWKSTSSFIDQGTAFSQR